MSNAELVSTIAHILEPWAFETKSYNATIARDDATDKATQIVEALTALAALDSRADDAGKGWKLVPVEPTEAMLHYLSSSADPRMTYAALLSATPAPAVDAREVYAVDDQGLFCRNCGRTSVRHFRTKAGNFCRNPEDFPEAITTAVDAVPAGEDKA